MIDTYKVHLCAWVCVVCERFFVIAAAILFLYRRQVATLSLFLLNLSFLNSANMPHKASCEADLAFEELI